MGIGRFFGRRAAVAFARQRGGNVAMMWGLLAAVLVGLIGITIDFTRAQALRTEMQNAADGAALVAERNSNLPLDQRTAAARAYFNAEAPDIANGVTFTVTPLSTGGHRVEVQMDMPMTMSAVVSNHPWNLDVVSEAEANVSPPIEVVMALDNTGSMVNDMQALRDAANHLADSLYALASQPDDVKVGLVPFVAQVNIGNQSSHLAWMDQAGTAPYNGELLEDREIGWKAWQSSYGSSSCANLNVAATQIPYSGYAGTYRINWLYSGGSGSNRRCLAYTPNTINYFDLYPSDAGWKGCVEARPEPYDITDDAPTTSTPGTMFVPFFWVDGEDTNYVASRAITTVSGTTMNYTPGDTSTTDADLIRADTFNVFKYRGGGSVTANANPSVDTTAPDTTGPNKGCPTPIIPLTNATGHSTITSGVNAMMQWNGGGTDQVEGLSWGWRVLSPSAPFTEGRPYHDTSNPVRKVLVLMTDGENTNLSDNTVLGSDYSAYNHLNLWTSLRSGVSVNGTTHGDLASAYRRNITSTSSYVSYINTRELQLCTNIKATGIEIYTVVFREPSTSIRQMLQTCATDSGHAFTADSQAELATVFNAIGTGIGKLRLTH